MRRVVLLALLALALPIAAAADSFEYANFGTVNSGTASISGSATVGSTLSLTSQLTLIADLNTGTSQSGALGWVNVTTGKLSSCASGLCFTGGTLSITNSTGHTLFAGTFTGVGTVMSAGGFTFINATVMTTAGTTQNVQFKLGGGTISGDTIVTPEPGTLGLLGTGLIGLAGIVRRKLRG